MIKLPTTTMNLIETEKEYVQTKVQDVLIELYDARVELYEVGISEHKFDIFLKESLQRLHKLQQELKYE